MTGKLNKNNLTGGEVMTWNEKITLVAKRYSIPVSDAAEFLKVDAESHSIMGHTSKSCKTETELNQYFDSLEKGEQ